MATQTITWAECGDDAGNRARLLFEYDDVTLALLAVTCENPTARTVTGTVTHTPTGTTRSHVCAPGETRRTALPAGAFTLTAGVDGGLSTGSLNIGFRCG